MFKFIFSLFLAISLIAGLNAQTTWKCDPAHSSLRFKTTHMGLVEVWGRFAKYETNFTQKTVGNDLTASNFTLEADVNSVDTEMPDRDKHLKSADFLDAEKFPQLIFASKSFKKKKGNSYELTGTLTLKGVTKPVTIQVKAGKLVTGLQGEKRIGFSGQTSINRKEFGVNFNAPMDNGDVLIGETIDIFISMEFIAVE
jgi:polyisoprenoid-binding protein YceI